MSNLSSEMNLQLSKKSIEITQTGSASWAATAQAAREAPDRSWLQPRIGGAPSTLRETTRGSDRRQERRGRDRFGLGTRCWQSRMSVMNTFVKIVIKQLKMNKIMITRKKIIITLYSIGSHFPEHFWVCTWTHIFMVPCLPGFVFTPMFFMWRMRFEPMSTFKSGLFKT